jgi:hypothetical protein
VQTEPSLMSLLDDACRLVCGRARRPRLIPALSAFREQARPPARTDPRHIGRRHGESILAFDLKATEQVELTITAVDRRGNPATFAPNTVEWLVDNPNVVTVTPGPDGKTATLAAVGPVGTAVVTVNADIVGDSAPDISGTVEVNVVSGAPMNITIVPGTPTEQP